MTGYDDSRTRSVETLPPPPSMFHFVGIGGIGMSGLARILLSWGYKVTGSDVAESVQVEWLRNMGIPVLIGHDDPAFAGLADIVVTNRRAAANAATELDAAEQAGARIIKRGDVLGMVANERKSVCVAGSHGKSTTSGMLSVALRSLDADPTFAVGAIVAATGTNAEPGEGPHVVAEADEFDRSFHGLFPNVAIITSVSFDHPDIYRNQDDYDEAFVEFIRNIKPNGTLVIAGDNQGARRVLELAGRLKRDDLIVQTFGETDEVGWQLTGCEGEWSLVGPDGAPHALKLGIPGRHNARDGIAAIVALHALGFGIDESIRAVGMFTGIGRRFEHKGIVNGVDIIDDYAHHPDEIQAVLSAARDTFPDRRIVAVHQPHTYSRTHSLLNEFAQALEHADIVVLLDIYGVGEENPHHISSAQLGSLISRPVHLVSDPADAAAKIADIMQSGDVVLTIGAGTITRVGPMLATNEITPPPPSSSQTRSTKTPMPGLVSPVVRIDTAPHLQFRPDVDMSLYTTMRTGGVADFLVRAQTADDIVAAVDWAHDENYPVTVIGGGSNLLVDDDGVRGLVIVSRTPGQRAESLVEVVDEGDSVLMTVGAQAPMSWLGKYCAERGWGGMDWAVGLPGQVGGATVNNAGAHGAEFRDHLVAVDVLQENGEVVRQDAEWLVATYRMTRIKGAPRPRPWVVLRSVFRLPKTDPAGLVALAREHADFRRRTQPTGACSGSIFANPAEDFSGRLIEEAGLAGFQVGAMRLSDKHANWMINTGGGTAPEAWELIRHVQHVVREHTGIGLQPEIESVGGAPE